jgi:hypothetical protein
MAGALMEGYFVGNLFARILHYQVCGEHGGTITSCKCGNNLLHGSR